MYSYLTKYLLEVYKWKCLSGLSTVIRLHEWPSEQSKSTRNQISSAHIFLGAMDWTKLNSINFLTHYLIIRFLRRLSPVQSVAPRWIRAEIICLSVDLLALSVIFMHANKTIDVHQNSDFVLFLRWRSRVIDNCCKPSFQKDTCLFWLKFPNKWCAITNFKILRELDWGYDDIKDSLV